MISIKNSRLLSLFSMNDLANNQYYGITSIAWVKCDYYTFHAYNNLELKNTRMVKYFDDQL